MNNTFNMNRFSHLLRRQWLDFGRVYLMSLIVLAIILVGAYLQLIPDPKENDIYWNHQSLVQLRFKMPLITITGFIFISVVASNYYNALGQKSKAIMDLMIPASVFEKFLAGLFYTAIVSIFSYLLIFYIIDRAFISYLNDVWREHQAIDYRTNKMTQVVFSDLITDLTDQDELKFLFGFPFLITSIFLLGSIYFNRFQYIKTALFVTGAASLIIYLIYKTASWLTTDMVRHSTSLSNDKGSTFLIIFSATLALTFAFWLVTYIRIKEKEV